MPPDLRAQDLSTSAHSSETTLGGPPTGLSTPVHLGTWVMHYCPLLPSRDSTYTLQDTRLSGQKCAGARTFSSKAEPSRCPRPSRRDRQPPAAVPGHRWETYLRPGPISRAGQGGVVPMPPRSPSPCTGPLLLPASWPTPVMVPPVPRATHVNAWGWRSVCPREGQYPQEGQPCPPALHRNQECSCTRRRQVIQRQKQSCSCAETFSSSSTWKKHSLM